MIRIFRPFLSGGVPEYKHDKSEIAILRKTPAHAVKVPCGTCISRVYGRRLRFLFVCHFASKYFVRALSRTDIAEEVDRSVRQDVGLGEDERQTLHAPMRTAFRHRPGLGSVPRVYELNHKPASQQCPQKIAHFVDNCAERLKVSCRPAGTARCDFPDKTGFHAHGSGFLRLAHRSRPPQHARMTIYRKQSLALLLSLACISMPLWAQTTFDPLRGEIAIPCVAVWDSRQVAGIDVNYRVLLRDRGAGSQFALAELAPTDYDTECSGSFDLATKVYGDVVNVGDQSWNIRLRRGADNVFAVDNIAPRGAAQTSLWIARNGEHRVYLAGAVHVLRTSDYPLPRAFEEAYAQSEVLYFERDLDAPGEIGFGSSDEIEALMRDPEGLTLAQQLAPATYDRLRDYLRTTWNFGMGQVNDWSAQMFVSTFSFSHMERIHGVTAAGVDGYLANRARADGKPIEGFETAAQQLAVLQAMDAGREDALMQRFLDACATNANLADFERLVSLWRRGDTATLNREEIAPMREADYADYELIQIQRNEAWLPRIEALLHTPEIELIVVGVAHMTGRDGLVARLRQLGYHVEKY